MPSRKVASKPDTDFLIIGAGLSGLSLALALLRNPSTVQKRVLLLDRYVTDFPDRTWCFWEKQSGPFDDLVRKRWDRLEILTGDNQVEVDLEPYSYKMISSRDFRKNALAKLGEAENVTLVSANVISTHEQQDLIEVATSSSTYSAPLVFDSRLDTQTLKSYTGLNLLQQFRGWYIETSEPAFDPDVARIMDFRASQDDAVAFFYVLPLSETHALIEYTLFTREAKDDQVFDEALKEYIARTIPGSGYRIVSDEEGIIPMTDYPFRQASPRIHPIGTAGGCTKPSSGYTFTFVQQQTAAIIAQLNEGELPQLKNSRQPGRFLFYDRVLLRILTRYPERGAGIFYRLFDRNNVADVLAFLDNSSSAITEMNLFRTLPIGLFARTAIRELLPRRH